MRFIVIDKKTGKEADEYEIALKEDWAKNLAYCDMEGFALLQDGTLILVDECGRFEYCPDDRFEIVFEDNEADKEGGAENDIHSERECITRQGNPQKCNRKCDLCLPDSEILAMYDYLIKIHGNIQKEHPDL